MHAEIVSKRSRIVAEAYALIAQHHGACSVRELCVRLGVSHSGYYAWRKRVPSARMRADEVLIEQIQMIFRRSHGTYGARRIRLGLLALGFKCGLHRVERLMRIAGCSAQPHWHTGKAAHTLQTKIGGSHQFGELLRAQAFGTDARINAAA